MIDRVLPILAFLATVVVLAELVAEAEVFDVVAARLAILGGGSVPALFGLSVGLATLTTITLNLDTTAVLLTPVLLALAARIHLPPLPLAMTTVWLANTASLLLPVSNLTNLLAASRVGLPVLRFAARTCAPALASVLVTALLLWLLHWRPALARSTGSSGPSAPSGPSASSGRRYHVPPPHAPSDPVLTGLAAVAVLLFLALVLAEVALPVASALGAVVVVVAFALRRRAALSVRLVPFRLLATVTALFLAVGFVADHGLDGVMRGLVGDSPWRAAAVGAVAANLVNNLPAYLAGEAAAAGDRTVLLALLVGVNVGPLVTPWASLATLIWFQRCRAAGVSVGVPRFVLTGLAGAIACVLAATAALVLTG